MIALRKILVAVDFDDVSEAALAYGRALAKTLGAQLHILHVAENLFMRPMASDPRTIEEGIARQLTERLTDDDRRNLHAVAAIRTSNEPADEIVQYAKLNDIDLIVMGTHGRQNVARLVVGSVAEKVVRTATCPVMAVRPGGHQFVVPDPPA
jgi:nucleotide-binding universal stress UspA family protein